MKRIVGFRAKRIIVDARAVVVLMGLVFGAAEWLNASSDRGQVVKDSTSEPQIPKGQLFKFTYFSEKIYPGTSRSITVYIPSEYSPDRPACVYVGLDGLNFDAPAVFDELIFKDEMPITIAIGIGPGETASSDDSGTPRFNRSFEFDSLSDRFARFVLQEIIPAVEGRKTPNGLPIFLSKNPNDRAAGGASTGGIGAFTLAWEHPDDFRRVFTAIGTFVGMRGGDRYPVLIRKTEPKPLRIFVEDGSNDEWPDGPEVGDWWLSNQALERALEFAGYQTAYSWGTEGHDPRHATAIFPDAMKWLWKDWPAAIVAGQTQNHFLKDIAIPGKGWNLVQGDPQVAYSLAVDPQGSLIFRNAGDGTVHKLLPDGSRMEGISTDTPLGFLAIGKTGRVYVSTGTKIVVSAADENVFKPVATVNADQFVVASDGRIYATELGRGQADGAVWLIYPDGSKVAIDSQLRKPSGLAITPDGHWLVVAESRSHLAYSYRLSGSGLAQDKQEFYWFHVPDAAEDSGANSLTMDRDGRLYAATRLGVQVFDHNGRVRAIIPLPCGRAMGLAFGGANLNVLYASCANHQLFSREVNVTGAQSWDEPRKLPNWGPG